MKRLISLILCLCLASVGVALETGRSYAEEQAVECEMYSTNANPIYANKSDNVILNILSADNVTVSAVTISEWAARKRTGTNEWEVDGDYLWRQGYLSFEISYSYMDESGNEVEDTQNILTSGTAVLFDAIAPVNIAPTMHAESSDVIRVDANATGLDGCVAPAHEYGYTFILYGETGNIVDSRYGYTDREFLFEGLQADTRYKASTKIKDAAGNVGNFSGLTFIRTMSADPLSLSITNRTNTSLSYVIDSSNQTDGTENKVILLKDGVVVSETAFGHDACGMFDGLSEGGQYQIQTITRNSDSVENAPHLFWTGTTKHLPEGEIVFPNEDAYLKDGQAFILKGTYEDDDGDDVAIVAHMGETAGEVNVGSTTWSAVWNMDGLPEGSQPGVSVSVSDCGGSEKTVLNWSNDLTIDRTEPSGSISYNTSLPTNGPVVATLATIDENEVFVINNGGSSQYEFTTNGSFTFEFRDAAGNTVSKAAQVTWIDTLAPNAPAIHLNPESGVSTGSVEVSLTHDESELVSVEYCVSSGGEMEWLPYESPFSVSEKGSWDVFARAIDAAGNESPESCKILVLKNRHKRETVEPSRTVDHYDINLPYLVVQGARLEMTELWSFYDINGKPIDMSAFENQNADSHILQIMDDGTIFAKNPGVVSLIVSDPKTEAVFTFDLEIEGPSEKSAEIDFTDTENQ